MNSAQCANVANGLPGSRSVFLPRLSFCGCRTCINLNFLKTAEGLLKVVEVILGSICQNLLVNYGVAYSVSLGSFYHGFLTTLSAGVLTSLVLVLCYVLSHRTFQLVRQSLFEPLFNGIISFLYLSSSCYLVFAVYSFLYPVYKITSVLQVYPAMSAIYIIGFILGSVHAYDGWLAYNKYY